ncbi:iron-binding protein IscA [bacterium BMS3Abin10]|nr:iron-binding protein IscA [bacterium BMS3Abin10]GBE39790.1 iron-binding protein IscA [bacterium BMS3Bbin08]
MFKITDLAVEKAKHILSVEGKTGWGFRVFMAGSSCCGPSFGMDIAENPTDGDKVVEKDGLKVFLAKDASEKLDSMGIDFVDKGQQQGFVITGGQPSSCSTEHGGSCG